MSADCQSVALRKPESVWMLGLVKDRCQCYCLFLLHSCSEWSVRVLVKSSVCRYRETVSAQICWWPNWQALLQGELRSSETIYKAWKLTFHCVSRTRVRGLYKATVQLFQNSKYPCYFNFLCFFTCFVTCTTFGWALHSLSEGGFRAEMHHELDIYSLRWPNQCA